jgi:hypothetical protein
MAQLLVIYSRRDSGNRRRSCGASAVVQAFASRTIDRCCYSKVFRAPAGRREAYASFMVASRRYLLADTHLRHVHGDSDLGSEAHTRYLAAQDELFAALAVVELTATRATSEAARHLVNVLQAHNEKISQSEIQEWDDHYDEVELALTEGYADRSAVIHRRSRLETGVTDS